MDDGSKMSGDKGVILCTESFTLEENYFLIKILTDKLYLDCNIQESSSRIRIYIKKNSIDKLINLVKPNMLPHFYYKLGI
jgi:LAGLIDADG DNA endonuclease family